MSGQGNLGPGFSWADDAAVRPYPSLRDLARRERRDRAIDLALQISIAIVSFAAIALVASSGPAHRWGFVVGLASQPLWIAATWRARQWGMFVLGIAYCGVWLQGIFNRF
jgi:hypothetical protein